MRDLKSHDHRTQNFFEISTADAQYYENFINFYNKRIGDEFTYKQNRKRKACLKNLKPLFEVNMVKDLLTLPYHYDVFLSLEIYNHTRQNYRY